VFSFGVVLTELILQQPPRKRRIETGLAFEVEEFQTTCPGDCPPVLSQLVLQCTALDPSKRPPVKQIVPLLRDLMESLPEEEQ